MKHVKRMLWVIPLGFVVLGVIGQLLISTGTIEEQKAGEKPKPTITKTITPKPSIDPWTQWNKFNVNWEEYSLGFEKLLLEKFESKDCRGMQGAFDALVVDNKDHAQVYGHNNVNMMRFVDYLLEEAKCYK